MLFQGRSTNKNFSWIKFQAVATLVAGLRGENGGAAEGERHCMGSRGIETTPTNHADEQDQNATTNIHDGPDITPRD